MNSLHYIIVESPGYPTCPHGSGIGAPGPIIGIIDLNSWTRNVAFAMSYDITTTILVPCGDGFCDVLVNISEMIKICRTIPLRAGWYQDSVVAGGIRDGEFLHGTIVVQEGSTGTLRRLNPDSTFLSHACDTITRRIENNLYTNIFPDINPRENPIIDLIRNREYVMATTGAKSPPRPFRRINNNLPGKSKLRLEGFSPD
jgi:hypothetical protein